MVPLDSAWTFRRRSITNFETIYEFLDIMFSAIVHIPPLVIALRYVLLIQSYRIDTNVNQLKASIGGGL